ncbi:uncharacterized protein LOC113359251 [Papaver somniferum]|uniref:uncharacterized protein LOC113359251 n=1 Tax=Papaver somniferum TaxID=3469 RepID=UPI000E6F8DE0|nr:uncharacterized protein LOC113359251 [Papaver somniferum]
MESSSNSSLYIQLPSIPLSHGENYDFWAIKMKILFMSQDVWEIVESGYDEIEDTSTLDQDQKNLLKESRKKNAKASMYIQQGDGDTILPRVIHFPKAKEAWDILQKEYGGNKKVRELKLHSYRRDFEHLKMNENECLNEFSSRVVEIVNNMMMCSEKMEERRICEKILMCLPEKFEHIVMVMEETKDFSTLKSQKLWASLKMYEQRLLRHSEKSGESAFQSKFILGSKNSATKKNEYKGESTSNFKGKGKWKKGGANSNNYTKSDSSQVPRCNFCKKNGHLEKNCWNKGKPQCRNCKMCRAEIKPLQRGPLYGWTGNPLGLLLIPLSYGPSSDTNC